MADNTCASQHLIQTDFRKTVVYVNYDWHFPRAFAREQHQEGHLPSASAETEPCAAAAANFQHPPRWVNEALCAPRKLTEQVFK